MNNPYIAQYGYTDSGENEYFDPEFNFNEYSQVDELEVYTEPVEIDDEHYHIEAEVDFDAYTKKVVRVEITHYTCIHTTDLQSLYEVVLDHFDMEIDDVEIGMYGEEPVTWTMEDDLPF